MIVHQVFAQIIEGEVKNIIVCDNYDMANWLAKQVYGDEAIAIDCLQYPCAIGDIFRDGKFYRILENGEEREIEYIPTQEQQVSAITDELISTQLALTEQYEENISLQDELTSTQLALTEIYERMEG